MRFAEPQRLFWLLGVLALVGGFLYAEARRLKTAESWIGRSLWSRVIPGWIPGGRARRAVILGVAMCFAVVALARPQWGSRVEVSPVSGLDVMLVLDLSNSMETEDVPPSRLSRSKHWIRTLLEQLEGDRVGLVGFAASAHVIVPLTLDLSYVLDQLQILSPKMVANQGTDIGLGLEVALQAMGRGAENAMGQVQESNQASHAIILITDGEDFEGQAQTAAKDLQKRGVHFSVIGVGTQKGGPIPVLDESGSRIAYKRDPRGQPIVSAFQPKTLVELAESGKGEYHNLTSEESEVREILTALGKLSRGDVAQRKIIVHEDRFQWPLAVAVLLLLLEFSVPLSRNLAAAVILLALSASSASAAGPFGSFDSYLENRQGLEKLQDKQASEAAEHFGRAQAQDPDRPEFEFNQGVAAAQKNDWLAAIRSFDETIKKSEKLAPASRALTDAQAVYNRGVAHSQAGSMDQAARSYIEAIRLAQTAQNKEIEERARKNLELLAKQDEDQKQKKDQQDKEQKQQEQQQKDQEQKKSEKPEDGKPEKPKEGPLRHQRTPFKSEKLKPEDAERVMSELSSKEKQLQERLRKQGKKGSGGTHDW